MSSYTGFVPFFGQKLQGFFKDFQGHISHFSKTPFSAEKSLESMSFLVLPQHEQFYPEGLSYYVLENLGWIKLAPKFKDFPAPTAIFKDFQGLELSRWVQTPPPPLTFTHSVPVFAGKFLFPLFLHLLKFGIISYWKKENNEFSQTKWFCYLCVLHPWRIKILKDAKHLIAYVP